MPELAGEVVTVESDREETAEEAVHLFKMAMRGFSFTDNVVNDVSYAGDVPAEHLHDSF